MGGDRGGGEGRRRWREGEGAGHIRWYIPPRCVMPVLSFSAVYTEISTQRRGESRHVGFPSSQLFVLLFLCAPHKRKILLNASVSAGGCKHRAKYDSFWRFSVGIKFVEGS